MSESAEQVEDVRPRVPALAGVGDVDLAPLGALTRAEVKELVLDDTGRVELAGECWVGTGSRHVTAWVVFTRHRLTCPAGVEPRLCGCGIQPDQFHAYLAEPDTDGAMPVRPDEPLPPRQCVDCPPKRAKPISKRGRCVTHYRQWNKRRSTRQYERAVTKYGITIDDYHRIHEAQGGRCAICRIATGAARRLSVDHDHGSGEVRGLLCQPCNYYLARIKNDPEAFARGLVYLIDPPARAVLPPNPEVDGPPLSDEERGRAAARVAEQIGRQARGNGPGASA
jgi:hypothetical protein